MCLDVCLFHPFLLSTQRIILIQKLLSFNSKKFSLISFILLPLFSLFETPIIQTSQSDPLNFLISFLCFPFFCYFANSWAPLPFLLHPLDFYLPCILQTSIYPSLFPPVASTAIVMPFVPSSPSGPLYNPKYTLSPQTTHFPSFQTLPCTLHPQFKLTFLQ